MKNGSPQVTPMWVDIENGYILVNTAIGRLKQKNISRDPRVALAIADQNNPFNTVTIRGEVIEQTYLVGFTTALNRTFPLATLSYALLIPSNGNISVITFTLPFAT